MMPSTSSFCQEKLKWLLCNAGVDERLLHFSKRSWLGFHLCVFVHNLAYRITEFATKSLRLLEVTRETVLSSRVKVRCLYRPLLTKTSAVYRLQPLDGNSFLSYFSFCSQLIRHFIHTEKETQLLSVSYFWILPRWNHKAA